jgi:hypothetical protein
MTLAKKGLRTIEVNGEKFVWRVRKKVSHEEKHGASLGIPIQHIHGGQLFIAHISYARSGYEACGIEGTGTPTAVTPAAIKDCIIRAISLGWQYKSRGKPVSIVNDALTEQTLAAKWRADLA